MKFVGKGFQFVARRRDATAQDQMTECGPQICQMAGTVVSALLGELQNKDTVTLSLGLQLPGGALSGIMS